MRRPSRYRRPGMSVSATRSLLLSASGGNVVLKAAPDTTTSIDLTWTAAVPKPDDYRIERSTDGITFSTVTTVTSSTTTYNDTGRTESTRYWYRIIPVLNSVDQASSNVASTWTVPATPTGLTATAISSTQINLAWTDVSTGNTAQSIQRRSPAGSGSYSFIASVGATATSYNDTGLTVATQYEYQVAATNPATQSAWSTAANATTTGGGPPSASWTLDFSTGEPWSNGANYVFSSTASTTRTYVDSSGYVAPCIANLQTQSALAAATWPVDGLSRTSTTETAPDGSSTATLLRDSSGPTYHIIVNDGGQPTVSASTVYTFSCYLKAGSSNYGALSMWFGSVRYTAVFELTGSGAVTSTSSASSPTSPSSGIESVGSGWYRCRVTYTSPVGATAARLFVCISNSATPTYAVNMPSFAFTNTTDIRAWGAQLVQGAVALPFSATTTSSNGIPRLTHNSSGSRLGLLVEGQRTNLQTQSALDAATWPVDSVTRVSTTETAPDNTSTATLLRDSSGVIYHFIVNDNGQPTVSASTVYTFSCYLKAGSSNYGALSMWFGSVRYTAVFELTGSGAVTSTSSNSSPTSPSSGIESVGNGWYRCRVTYTSPVGATNARLFVCISNSATPTYNANLPGWSFTNTTDVRMWGAQLEQAETVSSYIPTTTAAVTRSADLAYVETADVTNWGRPGSFVVEYYKPTGQSGGVVVADDDGAGNAGRLGVEYSAGGPRIVYGTSGSGSGGTDIAGLNKVGWAWDGSGAATRSALNGSALDTSLATSFDPTLTDGINLGGNIDWTSLPLTVSGQPNVVIRKVQFYNSQLSAADLNTLTGPTSYTVDALVVAGGGGGGLGGGGAGGYRTATGLTLTPGTTYTITVGAGGAKRDADAKAGCDGSNSVFSTITSTGGGKGGWIGSNGGTGGSGGGSSSAFSGTTNTTGGAGTSGQGNAGGNCTITGLPFSGAGGGGAGGAGQNQQSVTLCGNGGNGSVSSISGSSVTYAGGGGGGCWSSPGTGGTGGSGGGGNGGDDATAATAGTINRGGGGGGGGAAGSKSAAGGSGVVIIRMPTARYSGVHTPATVTTSGSDTILTFNASGTYTA